MTKPPFEQAKALTAISNLRHGFFGRRNGDESGGNLNVSQNFADPPAEASANRQLAMAALGMSDVALATLTQTHSTTVIVIDQLPKPDDATEADGLVTCEPDIALAIITADCAPILFADAEAGVIGACHAGWKGAINGVIANTVSQMVNLGATAERIVAAIGPTISGKNYEIGPDMTTQILAIDKVAKPYIFTPSGATREHFYLPGFVGAQLRRAGVTDIENIEACTYQNPATYFSHRHTTHHATEAGRQISIIAQR